MTGLKTFTRRSSVAALLMLLLAPAAFAHAVLVRSTPVRDAQVRQGDLPIELTYNSRIDATRSALTLVGPAGQANALTVDLGADPNVLKAKAARLTSGAYLLKWQVLASDGHITRGIVAFRVQ